MFIKNNDKLYVIIIISSGLLFISHGVCEHMGRYNLLAEHLAAEGIFVFGHDHGKYKIRTVILVCYVTCTIICIEIL